MGTNKVQQYIHEEQAVLTTMLAERSEIAQPAVSLLVEHKPAQIILLGSGSSYHAAVVARDLMEELLGVQVTLMYPTRFVESKAPYPANTLVIGLSQGGSSLSTISGLKKAVALGLPTIGITAEDGSGVATTADCYIKIRCGEEKAGAKTKGFVATILTLLLIALEGASEWGTVAPERYENLVERLGKTFTNIDNTIKASEKWLTNVQDDLLQAKHMMVVGYGVNYGIALEGALKLLETVRVPVIGYEMEEYMHGVYNCIADDSYILFLASAHQEKDRIIALKEYLSKHTSHCYVIASEDTVGLTERDLAVAFIDDPLFAAFEYVIPLQILSALLAEAKGVDPALPKFTQFHMEMGSKIQNK